MLFRYSYWNEKFNEMKVGLFGVNGCMGRVLIDVLD